MGLAAHMVFGNRNVAVASDGTLLFSYRKPTSWAGNDPDDIKPQANI